MPSAYIAEPHDTIASAVAAAASVHQVAAVTALHEINAADFIHDEAELLDADELGDAKAALVGDGIFESRDWNEADLRAATKYGWAVAFAGQVPRTAPSVWSVANGTATTTTHELQFIADELRRRSASITHLSICWPVTLEPAIDLGETAAVFLKALSDYAPIVRESDFGLFIPNAAGKFAVLPAILAQLGQNTLLDFTGLGWLAAARLLAARDTALFRRVLACAQQHFVFDKPLDALSTTEDDIRTLPDVPDADLARTFLDDLRGRQLLHVTARSILMDADLREPLASFLTSETDELNAAITSEMEHHLVQ